MKNRSFKMSYIIMALVMFTGICSNASGSPVLSVNGKNISMKNDVGCMLKFYYENGKYGLGTFYFQDVALGEPIKYFLTEDNVFENASNITQTVWPGTWHPYFQADTFAIIENTEENGIVRFSGRMGKLDGSVTITLSRGSSAYKLDYEMKVTNSIKHPIYVSAPFMHSKMEFVQFPFETPLSPPFEGQWSITPTLSMVPFMWGCEKINNQDYYVGVGYQLEKDKYVKGEILYNSYKSAPFQIYFISPANSGWFGKEVTKLHIVISTATSQYDCVAGYRNVSGFDVSTPIRRTLTESLKGVMDMYENCTAYVSLPPFKNKAYHHQIVPSTGKPPAKGYGTFINIGINVQLGYQLYKYWQEHPEETWAKERAINVAGLFMEVQKEDGSVPSLWSPSENRFRTYSKINTDKGYFYTMDRQAVGAYSLYRMYLAKKETEKIAVEEWKQSAIHAMDYIVDKVKTTGTLGRNYNDKGEYDMVVAPNEALIALDYFYVQTDDKKYDEAREILEKLTYSVYARPNLWSDWSSDWGGWGGKDEPPLDIDALNSLTFSTYCVYRHMHTGDQKYIEWAKHVAAYNWLVTIPVQYPGFKNVTKGLTREQDHYLTYDIPFRTTLFIDCYPYLSMITQDRYFMDYYKMLIQTQHSYQYPADKGFQSFNIGLAWEKSGAEPRDTVGEQEINYIVEFSSMYLESVTSPNAYRYVGGPDWGVGLDYDLAFQPDSKKGEPFVASASTNVTSAKWDGKTKKLSATLQGEIGSKGVLNVNWVSDKDLAKTCQVEINGEKIDKKSMSYDSQFKILKVKYQHKKKDLNINISL